MAIFNTDLEALIFFIIISVSFFLLNKLISILLYQSKKLSIKPKNIIRFVTRLIFIIIIVYVLIEGFPSFKNLDPKYTAILTGSISTALAFVSSEFFSNFMSGILLFMIDPFDIGDVVKIKGYKGVVMTISLTRVVLETFDRVKVDFANKELIFTNIQNYTVKFKDKTSFYHFKKLVLTHQYKGNAHLDHYLFEDKKQLNNELKVFYEVVKKEDRKQIHAYTFNMRYLYKRLRIRIDQTDKICVKFKEKFGFKPRFHLIDYSGGGVVIKFRILTLNAKTLMEFQPEFTKELYNTFIN
ncbi:MAG: mechanosensitive ion channel [Candidatus Lokiarchaeota archaeon]|nr:mechanosensitive ion channel [Candidatus Lokiarchaeota archaeon]